MTSTKDKTRIKKNHQLLVKTDLNSFGETSILPNRHSSTSLDTLSVESTISSTSGPITAWEQAWVLSNNSKYCSYSCGSASSSASSRSTTDDKSTSSSSSQSNVSSKVHAINDMCFLRNGGSLVVAESLKRRLKIFSNKHHTLLTTIDRRNKKLSSSLTSYFTPTCLSETNHEGVVAVSSQNKVYYITVDGPEHCDLEADITLKDRNNLSSLECLSGEGMMVAEKESNFLGTYNFGGQLLREYKKPVLPLDISWSPDHHVAAVVDRESNSVMLLDKECKLLNSINEKAKEKKPFLHPQDVFNNSSCNFSSPISVAWCRPHHIIVADYNGLTTFDFRNLSKELSLSKDINNAHVIVTNSRGNRLAVAQNYDQLPTQTYDENFLDNEIEDLYKKLNNLNVTRTNIPKINDLKKEQIKRDITKLESLKTKNKKINEESLKSRKIYTLKMFDRHGVSRRDASVGLLTD